MARWWWQLDAGPSDGHRDDGSQVCLESKRRRHRADGIFVKARKRRFETPLWMFVCSTKWNLVLFQLTIKPSIPINHQTIKPSKHQSNSQGTLTQLEVWCGCKCGLVWLLWTWELLIYASFPRPMPWPLESRQLAFSGAKPREDVVEIIRSSCSLEAVLSRSQVFFKVSLVKFRFLESKTGNSQFLLKHLFLVPPSTP